MPNYIDKYYQRKLIKHAYNLVEVTQSEYEKGISLAYMYILYGYGYCKVALRPSEEHNYKMVIDAIHLYQKNNPNKKVKEAYFHNLCRCADISNQQKGFNYIMNFINYELEKQKNGTSSFELDIITILQRLKDAIELSKNDLGEDYNSSLEWFFEESSKIEQIIPRKK